MCKLQVMHKEFPLEFNLDDGTHVVVNKIGEHLYDFTIRPDDGPERHFTLNAEEEFTEEKEKSLDFDELNALRRFWLVTNEDV